MSSPIRTVYVELRASAEKLKADMAEVNTQLATVGQTGKDAGARMSAGMNQASESFGKVARNVSEAALAINQIAKLTLRYSSAAAASGTTTDTVVNSYRALRIALDPTPIGVATVALGVLTEETIRLTMARAKLIEQQALIAGKSGTSISSVERLDAISAISGNGNATGLQAILNGRGNSTPLRQIAQDFASMVDPAQRAAEAVRLFGADHAAEALRILDSEFVRASDATDKFGLGLNAVSRDQIYTFRKDIIDLKNSLLDFSNEKAWWQETKTRTAEVAAAYEDMAKRAMRAISQLIDKQTGLGGITRSGGLSNAELLAASSRNNSTLGLTADDLFAVAQGAAGRQSQTLEGRRSAQSAAQARADAAYSSLSSDAQKRKDNPNDPSLLSGQQRFALANEQQSASALAASIGVQIKAMQDAKKAADELAERIAALPDKFSHLDDTLIKIYQETNRQQESDAKKLADYDAKQSTEKLARDSELLHAEIDGDKQQQEMEAQSAQLQKSYADQLIRDQQKLYEPRPEIAQFPISVPLQQRLAGGAVGRNLDLASDGATTQANTESNLVALQRQLALEQETGISLQQQLALKQQILQLQIQQNGQATAQQQVQSATLSAQQTLAQNQSQIGQQIGQQIGNLPKAVGDDIGGSIVNALLGHHPGKSIGKEMAEGLAQSLKSTAAGLLKSLIGGGVQMGLGALFGFAGGTDSAPGGMAIVGEKGPEIRYIPRGSQIIPHDQTRAFMSRGMFSGSSNPSVSTGDMHFHAHGMTDPQDFIQTVARELPRYLKSTSPTFSPYSR